MECHTLAHTFLNLTLDGVEWPVSYSDYCLELGREMPHHN